MDQNAAGISAIVCNNSMGLSTVDGLVRSLNLAYSQTMQMLGVTAAILTVSLAVVYYCGARMIQVYNEWRATSNIGTLNTHSKKDSGTSTNDDFAYYSADDLPEAPQAPKIAARIKKINALYREYNKAVAKHAMRKDQDPDGLMDASIIDAANDNYEYPKDEIRVRHNEGNEFVRVTW